MAKALSDALLAKCFNDEGCTILSRLKKMSLSSHEQTQKGAGKRGGKCWRGMGGGVCGWGGVLNDDHDSVNYSQRAKTRACLFF